MQSGFAHVTLATVYRTSDEELLSFLREVRVRQLEKAELLRFFDGRVFMGGLDEAVRRGLSYTQRTGELFSWLCVTNKGADRVNRAALSLLGITEADLVRGYPGDPHMKAGNLCIVPGLIMRLSRNLDKERGFVNGAIGVVETVLSKFIFLLRLTTGTLVLVHPIRSGGQMHLPCTYGYGMTIRRSQGSTLDAGCMYFDHCYPPERGYGYVGVSRFRFKAAIYHYGRIRRTDWLPVKTSIDDQMVRGVDSEDGEYDEENAEMDDVYSGSEHSGCSRDDEESSDEDDFDRELEDCQADGCYYRDDECLAADESSEEDGQEPDVPVPFVQEDAIDGP